MLGAISNPKKTITIPFQMDKIFNSIQVIPQLNKKYKLTKFNPVFNICTLEALEFLSVGVYIDFTLNEVSENKTEVTIEVRRKVGAFDQAHEVSNANKHLDVLFTNLSSAITLSDEEITKLKNTSQQESIELNKPWYENNFLLVLVFIIFWPVGIYGLYKRFKK